MVRTQTKVVGVSRLCPHIYTRVYTVGCTHVYTAAVQVRGTVPIAAAAAMLVMAVASVLPMEDDDDDDDNDDDNDDG